MSNLVEEKETAVENLSVDREAIVKSCERLGISAKEIASATEIGTLLRNEGMFFSFSSIEPPVYFNNQQSTTWPFDYTDKSFPQGRVKIYPANELAMAMPEEIQSQMLAMGAIDSDFKEKLERWNYNPQEFDEIEIMRARSTTLALFAANGVELHTENVEACML